MELLLYADDLIIIAENAIGLWDKLRTLREYCIVNKLIVNVNKSKILIVQNAGRKAKTIPFRYGNDILQVVDSYNYLGNTFTTSGLFNHTAHLLFSKAVKSMGVVWRQMIASKMQDWDSRVQLFHSIVSLTIPYASGIWGLLHSETIDKLQNRFFKLILRLPTGTPGYLLRTETGSIKLSIEVLKRALNFLEKITRMDPDRFPKICLDELIELISRPSMIQGETGSRSWKGV